MVNKYFTLVFCIVWSIGCGGSGGGEGTATNDFTGLYKGPMFIVSDSCGLDYDWEGYYVVDHTTDSASLTLQVGERYPKYYQTSTISGAAFEVSLPTEEAGECSIDSSYAFSDIQEKSAKVKWSVRYGSQSKCLWSGADSPCTVEWEGELIRE